MKKLTKAQTPATDLELKVDAMEDYVVHEPFVSLMMMTFLFLLDLLVSSFVKLKLKLSKKKRRRRKCCLKWWIVLLVVIVAVIVLEKQ